ncbi:uncharacterized protein PHACADRAFT_246414, partial [Phanerochaete carnosa HHB-10118-sp]
MMSRYGSLQTATLKGSRTLQQSRVQWPRGPTSAKDGEDDSIDHEVSEGVDRSRGSSMSI